MQLVPSLINGDLIISSSLPNISVTNPANDDVIAKLTCTTRSELVLVLTSAKAAFEVCKDVPVSERVRVMMRYQQLLKEHHGDIAIIVSSETGNTLADSKSDVWRCIEVVQAMRFYTITKTITARWFEDDIPCDPNMTISLK